MPTIEVSKETFKELSAFAVPFEDIKPEDVIKKLIKLARSKEGAAQETVPIFSTVAPPDLSHTKVLSAKVNGLMLPKANWNGLMERLIVLAAEKLRDVDVLSGLILAKHVKGEKTDQGFDYIKVANISVQGQDSNNAWKTAAHIATEMGFSIEITFCWYDTPKALNPGQVGKFILGQA
jgi:hypothetical protein